MTEQTNWLQTYGWAVAAAVILIAAALLAAGRVDELVGYTAGMVLGGDGRAAVAPLGLGALAKAPRFRLAETRALGGDVFHRWVALR